MIHRLKSQSALTDPDVLFPGAALLVILVCGWLLWLNLNDSPGAGSSDPIGKIYFKNRVAQRKFAARSLWGDLDTDAIVYNRDTIRTEDLSEAVIELNDGTRIEMDENSMIVLNISKEQADINFAYGAIQAKRSTAREGAELDLQISAQDKVIKSSDGDVKLAGEKDSKDLVVTLASGAAVIEKGGQSTALTENQQARVSQEKIEVQPLNLLLNAPAELSQIFSKEAAVPVSFAWNAGGARDLQLEVARDRAFANLAIAAPVVGNAATFNLAEGMYYWRISGLGQTGIRQNSDSRRFRVIRQQALQLYSPLDGQAFTYTTDPPLVNFSWKNDPHASAYQIQIAQNPNFSGSQSLSTLTTSVTRQMNPGTYYWKVLTRSAQGGAATESQAFRFTVSQLQKQEAPRPLQPKGRTLHQVLLARQGEMFNWLGSPELKAYEIEIASDPAFRNRATQKTAPVNFVQIRENLNPGNYYWRVRGQDARGLWSDYSAPAAFTVGGAGALRLGTPGPGAVLNVFELDANGLNFNWQAAGIQGVYRFSLGRDASMNGAQNYPPGKSTTLRLPALAPGDYFWKVVLLDGEAILAESETRALRIKAELPPPAILLPRNGGQVDMTRQDLLDFRWAPVPGAEEYELIFTGFAAGRPAVLARERTRATFYRFNNLNALDRGRFAVEIRAFARKNGVQVESQPARSDFRVELEELTAPEIDSPRTLFIE